MANFHKEGDSLDVLPATALTAGVLYQYGGKAGIANADSAVGEAGSIRITGTIILSDSDGVGFADGATVDYDIAGDKAVAAAGGDFGCGTAVGTTAGAGNIIVLLNGQ